MIRKGSITSTVDPRIYHYIDNWNGILDFYKLHHLYEQYKDELEYSYVRYLLATFVKTAAKYDKKEYESAVKKAIDQVNQHFPDYKNNKYLKNNNLKNIYLRNFSPFIGNIVYILYKLFIK